MKKRQAADLAVLGGSRTFTDPLHVGRPNIGSRERIFDRINRILDQRWLTNNGPMVQEFEQKVADYAGAKHCIAMCNGTVALEIAIRATNMTGEVIVPSYTFIATAHALQWQEITPVFCDINLDDYTIDPEQAERLITPRTTGIIGVHLWGRPCNVAALEKLARRHNLKLLFDAAHAFGCGYRHKMVGQFGDAEVFSFHATKLINSLEGGAVVTNNDELARKIRLMKNFGFSGEDNVTYIGTNGKMNEISAAMGLCSLEEIDHFIEINRRNYTHYREQLDGLAGIKLLQYSEEDPCTYPYITLEIDEPRTKLSRDELQKILRAENILARRYFYPGCHRMEPYKSYFPNSHLLLKNTEFFMQRVLSLPTGTAVSPDDIENICDIIHCAVENAQLVRSRLSEKHCAV